MKSLKKSLLPVLVMVSILGCQKDKADPECRDASCCHPEYNVYAESVENIPVQLTGPPQYSSWTLRAKDGYPTDPRSTYKSTLFEICTNSLDKIKELVPDFDPSDSTKINYDYQVSGKILYDAKNPTLTATPVLSISIDAIKKIKE